VEPLWNLWKSQREEKVFHSFIAFPQFIHRVFHKWKTQVWLVDSVVYNYGSTFPQDLLLLLEIHDYLYLEQVEE